MPEPPLPLSAHPLCDSALVSCLTVDDLAAHAFAHLLILPSTQRRGPGVVIPYGVSIEWDHTHGDIEVYDKRGRHLGSMDPVTGNMSKPAVPGRKIEL